MIHKNLRRKCTNCKKVSLHTGGQGHCKDCRNSYRRHKYNTNEAQRKKEIEDSCRRQKERYKRNMVGVQAYKRNNPCVDCGNSDVRCLEFDHREDEVKLFTIGVKMQSLKLETIMSEVAKCDVRCANCHRIRHHEARQFVKKTINKPLYNGQA